MPADHNVKLRAIKSLDARKFILELSMFITHSTIELGLNRKNMHVYKTYIMLMKFYLHASIFKLCITNEVTTKQINNSEDIGKMFN